GREAPRAGGAVTRPLGGLRHHHQPGARHHRGRHPLTPRAGATTPAGQDPRRSPGLARAAVDPDRRYPARQCRRACAGRGPVPPPGMLHAQVSLQRVTSTSPGHTNGAAMPAISADTVALPRIPTVVSTAADRSVVSVTTAPSGFEGEGFPVRRA